MIIDPDFTDHWKTRLLVELLGDEAAPVYLLRLWAHCQHRRAHVFQNITQPALKALCRFPGSAELLETSLLTSGFIRRDAQSLIVHQWEEYNSSLIANWHNGKKGGRPKSNGNPDVTHGLPMANPDVTQAKPIEKSREDSLEKTEKAPPPAPKRAATDTDDEWIAGIEAMDCYKPVNVRQELGKAQAWAQTNRRNCTRKFFLNWLNRSLEAVRTIATRPASNQLPSSQDLYAARQ